MSRGKVLKLREVTRLHNIWLQVVLYGRDSVSPSELQAVKSYGKLPMDMDLSKSLALVDPSFATELLSKADGVGNPVRTPTGPKNTGTGGTPSSKASGMASNAATGAAAGKNIHGDLYYVSKKDSPKGPPPNTVDTTPSGYYVKAGGGKPATEEQDQRRAIAANEAKVFGKKKFPVEEIMGNLKNNDIVAHKPLGEDMKGASDSYRVLLDKGGWAMMKPNIEIIQTRIDTAPQVFGDGASVPAGDHTNREAAAFSVSMMHGLRDHIPPTVVRSVPMESGGNQNMSMQQWVDNMAPQHNAVASRKGDVPTNYTQDMLNLCPANKREALEQKLNEIVVQDIITNNTDRWQGNLMVSEDFSDIRGIDHGMSFGNGLQSMKNTIHADIHNMGKKVKIPSKMQVRMRNLSLADYKRTMRTTNGLSGTEVVQAWGRNRYALHLQDTEGHIDFEKFRPVQYNVHGESRPHNAFYSHLPEDEFYYRKANGMLPNQLFESWFKAFLEKAASDPSHPDHEDAKAAQHHGAFRGPGHVKDPFQYRQEGHHKEYEKTITANFDLPAKIRRDTVTTTPSSKTMPPPGRKRRKP